MGITDKLPLLNSKSKIVKIVGYVLYAFIILMIIGAMAPSEDTGATTSDVSEDKETTTSDAKNTADVESSGVLTAADVEDMLPGGVGDPVDVTVDGEDVNIVMPFKDNAFGSEYILMGTRDDAVDIFKKLFKDSRVSSVTVSSQVPLVDKYGNDKTGTGTKYMMTSSTADKINWDNFNNVYLLDVADSAYIHPSMID